MFANYQQLIALKQNVNLFGKNAGQIASDVVVTTHNNNSMVQITVVDRVNNVQYVIYHSNGNGGVKTVNLSGYTLYLDTLNTNVTLSSSTNVQPYQTIIAYKNL